MDLSRGLGDVYKRQTHNIHGWLKLAQHMPTQINSQHLK
jgi:hypothetical protein